MKCLPGKCLTSVNFVTSLCRILYRPWYWRLLVLFRNAEKFRDIVKFDVLMTVVMQIIFWYMAVYSLLRIGRYFRGTYCYPLQCERVSRENKIVSRQNTAVCIPWFFFFGYGSRIMSTKSMYFILHDMWPECQNIEGRSSSYYYWSILRIFRLIFQKKYSKFCTSVTDEQSIFSTSCRDYV
jgi:hypothetical protein